MILWIIVLVIAFLVIGCSLFIALPNILNELVDAYFELRRISDRIKGRDE